MSATASGYTDEQIRRYGKMLRVKGTLRLDADRYPETGPEGVAALERGLAFHLAARDGAPVTLRRERDGRFHVLTLDRRGV